MSVWSLKELIAHPRGYTYVPGSWESISVLPPICHDAQRIQVMGLRTAVFWLHACAHFWQPGQQQESRKWRHSPTFCFPLTLFSQKAQMLGQKVRTGRTQRKQSLALSKIIIPALSHFSKGKTSKQSPNKSWENGYYLDFCFLSPNSSYSVEMVLA